MVQLNLWTTRELAKLGVDFDIVNINNTHATHHK